MKNLPVRRVHTGQRLLDEAQRSAQESARRLNAHIYAGGLLLHAESGQPDYTGLAFTGGTARSIAHGLGRKAVGWIEVYGADLASAANVGLRTTAHPSGITSATHITVTPANTGTAFLFVF